MKTGVVTAYCRCCKRLAKRDESKMIFFCPMCMRIISDEEVYIKLFLPKTKLS